MDERTFGYVSSKISEDDEVIGVNKQAKAKLSGNKYEEANVLCTERISIREYRKHVADEVIVSNKQAKVKL